MCFEDYLEGKPFRILIVDDYEPWRRFAAFTLQAEAGLSVVGEACDGSQAINKAQELQPHLILLDIGLPITNGIAAAREIRRLAPAAKILFASENRSTDIIREALDSGGLGYLYKSDAGTQLVSAVKAVLQGKRFLSDSLICESSHVSIPEHAPKVAQQTCHEIDFYTDENSLLNRVTEFIASALKAGGLVVVVATRAHRESIVQSLRSRTVNIDQAEAQGRYVAVDAVAMLSKVMVDEMPDPVRFKNELSKLVDESSSGREVAIYGEGVEILLEQGNIEAAVAMEKLTNEFGRHYPIHVLCACRLGIAENSIPTDAFERICAQHSM